MQFLKRKYNQDPEVTNYLQFIIKIESKAKMSCVDCKII